MKRTACGALSILCILVNLSSFAPCAAIHPSVCSYKAPVLIGLQFLHSSNFVLTNPLRGGSEPDAELCPAPGSQALTPSAWNSLSSWVGSRWENLPQKGRATLQNLAVEMLDQEANLWMGKPAAVKSAMVLLALKVAAMMFPQWRDLWLRLEHVVKEWKGRDPGTRAEMLLLDAVEGFFLAKSGARLSIGKLKLPSAASNVFEMRDIVVYNPAGFSEGGEAVRVERFAVSTRLRLQDMLGGRPPLLVVDHLAIHGLR
eukprot:CAMPEP_0181292382 /NCGR_PEP_ID=MMETSP1101-20121128/2476_1 /TAXON_ID=46948 /ORGANISM="Rhodomonas abbreviata, Strain Caron Lab Isolate" /LENGTH=256 /DNA_ID=CAMNT_0023396847 /DNA_START=106 /DNA_END=873 /DNA_ORIENTATION=-